MSPPPHAHRLVAHDRQLAAAACLYPSIGEISGRIAATKDHNVERLCHCGETIAGEKKLYDRVLGCWS